MYWQTFDKEGWNPIKKEKIVTKRRGIKVDMELPLGNAYNQFILEMIHKNTDDDMVG